MPCDIPGERLRRRSAQTVPNVLSGSGRGVQPTITCRHRRATALSLISGKCRRSSTTPDRSPPSSQARRMAAAVVSSTRNMFATWGQTHGRARRCGPTRDWLDRAGARQRRQASRALPDDALRSSVPTALNRQGPRYPLPWICLNSRSRHRPPWCGERANRWQAPGGVDRIHRTCRSVFWRHLLDQEVKA